MRPGRPTIDRSDHARPGIADAGNKQQLVERHAHHQRSTDHIEASAGSQEMSKRLEVPSDLEHLIEKRDDEKDRRGQGRRSSSSAKPSSVPASDAERRKGDRRKKPRRKPSK